MGRRPPPCYVQKITSLTGSFGQTNQPNALKSPSKAVRAQAAAAEPQGGSSSRSRQRSPTPRVDPARVQGTAGCASEKTVRLANNYFGLRDDLSQGKLPHRAPATCFELPKQGRSESCPPQRTDPIAWSTTPEGACDRRTTRNLRASPRHGMVNAAAIAFSMSPRGRGEVGASSFCGVEEVGALSSRSTSVNLEAVGDHDGQRWAGQQSTSRWAVPACGARSSSSGKRADQAFWRGPSRQSGWSHIAGEQDCKPCRIHQYVKSDVPASAEHRLENDKTVFLSSMCRPRSPNPALNCSEDLLHALQPDQQRGGARNQAPAAVPAAPSPGSQSQRGPSLRARSPASSVAGGGGAAGGSLRARSPASSVAGGHSTPRGSPLAGSSVSGSPLCNSPFRSSPAASLKGSSEAGQSDAKVAGPLQLQQDIGTALLNKGLRRCAASRRFGGGADSVASSSLPGGGGSEHKVEVAAATPPRYAGSGGCGGSSAGVASCLFHLHLDRSPSPSGGPSIAPSVGGGASSTAGGATPGGCRTPRMTWR